MTTTLSRFMTIVCTLALLIGCAAEQGTRPTTLGGDPSSKGRLYEGFDGYHRAISTPSAEAQRWFDQGLQLLYGFNHDEAIRSFRKAAAIDPECAMAWWGVAYASGMHINNPVMTEEQSRDGYEAAQEAVRRAGKATQREQALIHAVAQRYAWPAPEDRHELDVAYADAMAQAWAAHPEDADVGALFAESLMDLQPWDLWTHDGQPKGRAEEIVATLERVMQIAPRHPGANHFYIHAVEASPSPQRAVRSADLLTTLVPGSGHLVHMPAHIYIRVGRYSDAAESNVHAIAADTSYFKTAPPPRFYTIYFIHNLHFLAYASMMEGRQETALAAARQIERDVPEAFIREWAKMADGLMPTIMHVLIRFGRWNEILAEPEAPEHRLVSRAIRRYARGVALAALDRTSEARAEMDAFDSIAGPLGDDWFVGNNPARVVLPLARKLLEAEILYREGNAEEAFVLLRAAAADEDALVYDEPPGWMQPVRHALGALLLASGQAAEAEQVYRDDLVKHPNNGWSLLGLEQALRRQNRTGEAEETAKQLAAAWPRADVQPTSSCYCQPGILAVAE